MAELFDSLAGRPQFTQVCAVFSCPLGRPETASDVISGTNVDQLALDVRVKFGDSRSIVYRDIQLPQFVMGERRHWRTQIYSHFCRQDPFNAPLCSTQIQLSDTDIPERPMKLRRRARAGPVRTPCFCPWLTRFRGPRFAHLNPAFSSRRGLFTRAYVPMRLKHKCGKIRAQTSLNLL